jgi:cardiolipin synthase
MPIKNWKNELLTIPNMLSIFRLILIPVYMVIYLQAETAGDFYYYVSGGILAVSCLTDAIDGKIARHFNMISNLGKILDPLADKATQLALIVCLALRYSILWLLIGLFVVKESFQVIAGLCILRKGKILSGAHISGKICTAVLFISLILMVLFPHLDIRVIYGLTILDAILLIISFINYARIYYTHSPMIQELNEGKKDA